MGKVQIFLGPLDEKHNWQVKKKETIRGREVTTVIGNIYDRNGNDKLDKNDWVTITGNYSPADLKTIFNNYDAKEDKLSCNKGNLELSDVQFDKSGNIIGGEIYSFGSLYEKCCTSTNPIINQTKNKSSGFTPEEDKLITRLAEEYNGVKRCNFGEFKFVDKKGKPLKSPTQSVTQEDIKYIVTKVVKNLESTNLELKNKDILTLIKNEGLMRWVYDDVGEAAVGVGHRIFDDKKTKEFFEAEKNPNSKGLSNDQIADYLIEDLKEAKAALIRGAGGNKKLIDKLRPGQKYALIDLCFNVGSVDNTQLQEYLKRNNLVGVIDSYDFVGERLHAPPDACIRRIQALERFVEDSGDKKKVSIDEKLAAMSKIIDIQRMAAYQSEDLLYVSEKVYLKIKNSLPKYITEPENKSLLYQLLRLLHSLHLDFS